MLKPEQLIKGVSYFLVYMGKYPTNAPVIKTYTFVEERKFDDKKTEFIFFDEDPLARYGNSKRDPEDTRWQWSCDEELLSSLDTLDELIDFLQGYRQGLIK